jgi:N6-L-threonylcarbamoyladenine synthase
VPFPLLALETSCDETAAALIGEGGVVLGHCVASQIEDHRVFGGVVPELASRCHVEAIDGVVEAALADAGLRLDDVVGVAATVGPGLVGCLLVGASWAQGLALAKGLPLLGINHMEGHLLAPFIGAEPPFPFLGLVVSGGHTMLIEARGLGDYRLLGETRDDAAGEAFDKSAKLLGLPYPGGVEIDRLAQGGNRDAVPLPRGMAKKPGLEFSFSGLKTAVWKHVQSGGVPEGQGMADLCASIQEAIVDSLRIKTVRAVKQTGLRTVVLTGGVAANSRLRSMFEEVAAADGWTLHIAERRYCTDNAAMIGYAAALRMARGERQTDLDVSPSLPLVAR